MYKTCSVGCSFLSTGSVLTESHNGSGQEGCLSHPLLTEGPAWTGWLRASLSALSMEIGCLFGLPLAVLGYLIVKFLPWSDGDVPHYTLCPLHPTTPVPFAGSPSPEKSLALPPLYPVIWPLEITVRFYPILFWRLISPIPQASERPKGLL